MNKITLCDKAQLTVLLLLHFLNKNQQVAQKGNSRLPESNMPEDLRNSYTMGCSSVRGDNPRALASGLSYVQVDIHGITILCHLHQCRHCTLGDISC